MTASTTCQQCGGPDVRVSHLVERSYLHPMMGVILGVVTAAFFVVNTGDLLTAFAVAVGIAALPRFVAVRKRIIGYNYRCDQCGHRWTSAPSLAVPRLSHD